MIRQPTAGCRIILKHLHLHKNIQLVHTYFHPGTKYHTLIYYHVLLGDKAMLITCMEQLNCSFQIEIGLLQHLFKFLFIFLMAGF
jgi:hypothetical protein